MDEWQQRIAEIAQQIPGYAGYQSKERRRDADKLVRAQLAARYEEQRAHLARWQQQAPLDYADDLERLDQKLQRLIARLNTAPRGYAGWFDAAQIVEGDLDALTQFDAALAEGVTQLKTVFDQIATALKSKEGVGEAIGTGANTLDALNARFDQREQFVALGKKPSPSTTPTLSPTSPLGALQAKKAPPAELVALAGLKVNDAVTFGSADYIVAGKITYTIATGSFWAFLLQDRAQKRWLRVGPGGEVAICQEIELTVPSPLPDTLMHDQQSFACGDVGTANVSVEGAGGVKRGSVNYARYIADAGSRLWIEDFVAERHVMWGQTIDASELRLYRR
jgi:hypothetical protein